MARRRDPVVEESDDDLDVDLHGVATWERRSTLDAIAVGLHRVIVGSAHILVVLAALGLLVAIGGMNALTDPAIGALTLLSMAPAFALVAYVWHIDAVTEREPIGLMAATFLLALLTASFAAVLNRQVEGTFAKFGIAGSILFFFIIVGPIEETVKLAAVRMYAYTDERFDNVVDGAVYGAVAGLGFAFIENAFYINRQVASETLSFGLLNAGSSITAVRALAGPGHVIYAAFAGYYLGLAKFNPENRGPIIVKGLLIAALIHALYNATVTFGAGAISSLTGLPPIVAFLVYVLIYDGLFTVSLLAKVRRYNVAYAATHSHVDIDEVADPDEVHAAVERALGDGVDLHELDDAFSDDRDEVPIEGYVTSSVGDAPAPELDDGRSTDGGRVQESVAETPQPAGTGANEAGAAGDGSDEEREDRADGGWTSDAFVSRDR